MTTPRHPLYGTWNQMKQRCQNKNNHKYHLYGRRGIKVCKRWRDSFKAFAEDMGPRPSPEHSIDRIDTDGNYTPNNCRWATRSEQRMNHRDSIHITFNGKTQPLKIWAEAIGVRYATAWKRIKDGTPIHLVLFTGNLCSLRKSRKKSCR